MKRSHLSLFLFLLLAALLISCERSRAGITVAGSTSVEPFAELLAEEYMRTCPDSHIYVQGGGSTAGVVAVRTQAAQIGMSSRSLLPTEKDLHAVTIAKDALAVIVHPTNPVSNLSLIQVQQVFAGQIRRWGQLGGPPDRIILVTREEGSGTREAFQNFIMKKEEISLEALVQDSNGAIRQVVSNDPHAIGFISLGLVDKTVRALSISGVEPTHENIERGRYTLVRPFLFLFRGEPEGEAKSFLDCVLSPRGQEILAKEGLIAVGPKTEK